MAADDRDDEETIMTKDWVKVTATAVSASIVTALVFYRKLKSERE